MYFKNRKELFAFIRDFFKNTSREFSLQEFEFLEEKFYKNTNRNKINKINKLNEKLNTQKCQNYMLLCIQKIKDNCHIQKLWNEGILHFLKKETAHEILWKNFIKSSGIFRFSEIFNGTITLMFSWNED